MYSIRKITLFLYFVLCFSYVSNAQIFSEETCIYKIEGMRHLLLVKFNGEEAYVGRNVYENDLRKAYEKSPTGVENIKKNQGVFYYDDNLSTSVRLVYKKYVAANNNYFCLAVSKNLSTVKIWTMNKDNGLICGEWQYVNIIRGNGEPISGVRMDPDIFKPEATNNDFLND